MGKEVEKENEREIWKGRVRDGQRRKIKRDAQAKREIKKGKEKEIETERCRERSKKRKDSREGGSV